MVTLRAGAVASSTSGYDRRALVEVNIGRDKRVIGNALRSHTEELDELK